MRSFLITFEDAQRLKPFFEHIRTQGKPKEARVSASRILHELQWVRQYPEEYKCHQINLSDFDGEFFGNAQEAFKDE